eukprot:CAMPEP_0119334586 /NCGR_PEP_ID=MMETSP1333-20130426/87630_1 /TAXON_ID=418940 /ORGANISM="Scyphosphaera apsteinii, Strain RCC1455" /LENGTH=120 /DNA_ID=CAMNT_0007344917 /DNA_START=101 /DNA_END=463 /DNA_ORIENTATION=+
MKHAVELAIERGFNKTYSALTNEEARKLISKHGPFAACVLTADFHRSTDEKVKNELAELMETMKEHEIPVGKCPHYGDSITPLFKLGLYQPQFEEEAIARCKALYADYEPPQRDNLQIAG